MPVGDVDQRHKDLADAKESEPFATGRVGSATPGRSLGSLSNYWVETPWMDSTDPSLASSRGRLLEVGRRALRGHDGIVVSRHNGPNQGALKRVGFVFGWSGANTAAPHGANEHWKPCDGSN